MQPLVRVCRTAGALVALVILVGGCCAPASDKTSAFNTESKIDQSRAIAALNRVNAFANVPAHLVVDPSDRPTAWSWADGTVCVSRGFIQRTSDEELTAVVAHELGHLCLARDGTTAAVGYGFRGNGSLVVEHQADEVAVRLLRHAGVPVDSLARALEIVRDAPATGDQTRQALQLRINLINGATEN